MPLKAIERMLVKLGAKVPEVEAPTSKPAQSALQAYRKALRPAPASPARAAAWTTDVLPRPPFKGELGERIGGNVCASCWHEWLGNGTKVINELRLSLASEEDQRVYDQYMIEFLGLAED